MSNKNCKDVFRQLRTDAGNDTRTHYSLVRGLYLSVADIGREALQALQDLLVSERCMLYSLDLSFTQFDGYSLVQSLKNNSSLTSLDVRSVPRMKDLFETIGDLLLQSDSKSRLSFFRCDSFELSEGDTTFSLRERPFQNGELRLVLGLVKNNASLKELDLTATDLEFKVPDNGDSVELGALIQIIGANTKLVTLRMAYNPALDNETKAGVRAVADQRKHEIKLEI
jgi:hypothetical protein